MGLLSKLGQMRMKDPVEGTLTVVGITTPDPTATSTNYRLDGVVAGQGIEPTAVVHHGMTSVAHWPSPGDVLPVTFDRAKPERLVINWDGMKTSHQQAASAAQALAEQMRSGAAPAAAAPTPAVPTTAPAPAAPFVGNTDPDVAPRSITAADILARGTAGTALINGVFPSAEPSSKPASTIVGLEITVSIPGQPQFMCKNLYAVPNDKVVAMVVGVTLPVKADLSMPGAVAVDWDAIQVS